MLLCGADTSLQTSFTKDNPRTQTKNNIGRSPRDAGDAPEGLGEHDSHIEKDNRSQGQTFGKFEILNLILRHFTN